MQLSIIIVSYNTQELTIRCLNTLHPLPAGFEIIVVDNASTDDSVTAIKSAFPAVRVITQSQNTGFAQANNAGVKAAQGTYVLLLNSDTECAIGAPALLLSEAVAQGAVIATCRLINPDGSLQPQGGALPTLLNTSLWMLNLDHFPLIRTLIPPYQNRLPATFTQRREMGWVGGTALLIKTQVYRQLGGLDEHLFMYAEDVDFCYRAHQQGYRVSYFPQPIIMHRGQGSATGRAITGEFTGLKYYFQQHKPAWQLPVLRFFLKTGALLRLLLFGMIGKRYEANRYRQAFSLA